MNISVLYVDNRAFTGSKDCIGTIGIRCNIATLNVDLAAINTKNYRILTSEITVVIACSITSFIENAVFDIYDCFILPIKAFWLDVVLVINS